MKRKPRYWTHKSRPGQKFLGNYERYLDPNPFGKESLWRHKFKLKNINGRGKEFSVGTVAKAKAKGWRLK